MAEKKEINFTITLDENHVPEKIEWDATDNEKPGDCDAIMLKLWDKEEQNTLSIDLWTKEMFIHNMKNFYYQSLLTMTDNFEKATGEEEMAKEMREFSQHFGEKMELIKKNEG